MKTREIAILVNTGNCSGRELLRGILRFAAASRNWNIRICDLADHGEERFLSAFRTGEVAGIITSELEIPQIARALEQSSVPLSVIGTRKDALPGRTVDFVTVTSDEIAVGSLGAQTLLKLGVFNSFGFVNMRNDTYRYLSSLREQGFSQQLRSVGITPFFYNSELPESETDEADLREWIRSLPKPTAVLAANDARAEDVLRATLGARFRIPADVSIMGVDDDEFKCLSTTPNLSSIHLDAEGQGFEAARQLDRLLRSRRPATVRKSYFAGHVCAVERSSTRTLAPGRSLVTRAREFIVQNADHDITVNDVVAFSRVSQRLLFLRFREFSDKSIQETINLERVRYFCRRLKTDDGTIREIAERCGFSNMATLRARFTAVLGRTIRDWRRDQA